MLFTCIFLLHVTFHCHSLVFTDAVLILLTLCAMLVALWLLNKLGYVDYGLPVFFIKFWSQIFAVGFIFDSCLVWLVCEKIFLSRLFVYYLIFFIKFGTQMFRVGLSLTVLCDWVCKKVCGSRLFVYHSIAFLISEDKINLLMFTYDYFWGIGT